MPELPEVETIRRQLEIELKGCAIVGVQTTWEKSFRPSLQTIQKAVIGKKVEAIERQAKLIIFKLKAAQGARSEGQKLDSTQPSVYLLFHLKLTGRLLVRKPTDPADDYTRSVFRLSPQGLALRTARRGLMETKELRFADARKFGFVKLVGSKEEMAELLKGYGPEPFKDLKLKNFTEILGKSARPVKIVLMDQEKISGVGNIYANDALWLARIHPKYKSNKLERAQVMALYKAVLVVLKRGLKYGGASDQWYRQVHGEEGKYQEHFLVYGKNGEKCPRCGGEIKRIVVGGRGTFICPRCQVLTS